MIQRKNKPIVVEKDKLSDQSLSEHVSFRMVLNNFDFRNLLFGQFFGNLGDAIFRLAIILYVYGLTGSKTLMTFVLAAQTAPWIIFGPIAGVFADKLNRKKMMIAADSLRLVVISLLPFATNIYVILVISFLLGLGAASYMAPRSAAIPEITGMKLYVKAISLSQLVFQTIAVLGPLLAAPIYGFLGPTTFWISTGCFLISILFVLRITVPSASRNIDEIMTVRSVFIDLKEGLKFLFTHPVVRLIIVLFTIIIIGMNFATPLLYPWIFEIRHNGEEALEQLAQREFGLISAFTAVGSIIGNLLYGKFDKQIGPVKAVSFGSFGFALYFFIFVFKPSLPILGLAGMVMGTMSGMLNLSITGIFAKAVPNEIRGRAFSAVNAYFQIFSVVFLSLSGLTADAIGVVATMSGAAIFLTLFLLIFALKTKFFKFLLIKEKG